ncbi:hypothetical protein BDF20DRAFT_887114 [Mycotypha africana]|uniref:uncharacterized protein n=1 Tax=Mycotypha africana TaxID=64632 RepID=UPI002301BEE3|nr:uncharacterized protein BDF20DRAFT_887114 [Mycotypha africana]KAI8971897.1 hypothetical protein BDF20DRAFT_887114 [Mycotypha africana]
MLHTYRIPFHVNKLMGIINDNKNSKFTASDVSNSGRKSHHFNVGEDEFRALREAFQLYDTKQKGYIYRKQFTSILCSLDFLSKEKLARYLVEDIQGSNENDTINFDRFAATLIELLPSDDNITFFETPNINKQNQLSQQHYHSSFDEKLFLKHEQEEKLIKDIETEEIKACFQVFDLDKDGRISRKDLEQIMVRLGSPLTQQELKDMMTLGDKNKDGFIDFEEFKQLLP